MDPRREAWIRKFSREPQPWRGPVHAAPLLADLHGRVIELGAGGGKVSHTLPTNAIAFDWAAIPSGRAGALADVRALPIRDASVDAVVAIHVLGHLVGSGTAARALREWRRALRPGGVLVLEVFARGDARDGDGAEVEPHTYERDGITTHYFDPEELRALLVGFEGELAVEERAMRWGHRRVLRGRFVRPGRD